MPLSVVHRGTIARWLPKDPAEIVKYHNDSVKKITRKGIFMDTGEVDEKQLSQVILEFKRLIEEDPNIYRDFHEMFEQVIAKTDIKDYMTLLATLNDKITEAPQYSYVSPLISGVPMYGIIAPFCNTEAGYRAFTNTKVNAVFHRIFDEWTRFLVSPASRDVLVTTEGGWFSPEALTVQTKRLGMSFEQAWVCYPFQPNYGFTSWDDFFVRRFRQCVRPTLLPDRGEFINTACEALTYIYVTKVQARDDFWIKEMPYSLDHVLNYDPLASQFYSGEGGKVFQAMLSSLDYHRWHSPVDGRVVRAYVVPGTYYAARTDDDTDIDVVSRSQAFVTAMATRALIFIESDNPDIGLMCFVGVGLGEISTTKLEVREGDRLKKGDELGSFRFGGSTHLLVFRPETQLTLLAPADSDGIDVSPCTPLPNFLPEDEDNPRRVGTLLFRVDNIRPVGNA